MRMLFVSGNTHTVAGPSTFCWRTRRKNRVSVGVMVRFAGNLANFSKKLLIRRGNKNLKGKVYLGAYFLASLPGCHVHWQRKYLAINEFSASIFLKS